MVFGVVRVTLTRVWFIYVVVSVVTPTVIPHIVGAEGVSKHRNHGTEPRCLTEAEDIPFPTQGIHTSQNKVFSLTIA